MGDSIGAAWPDMGGQSRPTTEEQRAEIAAAVRRGLPEVRHKVLMRYERLFGVWRVTFSDDGRVLRECRFEHDHTLEETIRRGRGMTCLEDRQSVERGMSQGQGAVFLQLDADQYAALTNPA